MNKQYRYRLNESKYNTRNSLLNLLNSYASDIANNTSELVEDGFEPHGSTGEMRECYPGLTIFSDYVLDPYSYDLKADIIDQGLLEEFAKYCDENYIWFNDDEPDNEDELLQSVFDALDDLLKAKYGIQVIGTHLYTFEELSTQGWEYEDFKSSLDNEIYIEKNNPDRLRILAKLNKFYGITESYKYKNSLFKKSSKLKK